MSLVLVVGTHLTSRMLSMIVMYLNYQNKDILIQDHFVFQNAVDKLNLYVIWS